MAALFMLKALAIFTIALALTASTPMNTTLQAAASLRVPGRLVHLAMLTHCYLFLFATELGRLRLQQLVWVAPKEPPQQPSRCARSEV